MVGDCLLALIISISEHVKAPDRDLKLLSAASLQVHTPACPCLKPAYGLNPC